MRSHHFPVTLSIHRGVVRPYVSRLLSCCVDPWQLNDESSSFGCHVAVDDAATGWCVVMGMGGKVIVAHLVDACPLLSFEWGMNRGR